MCSGINLKIFKTMLVGDACLLFLNIDYFMMIYISVHVLSCMS